LQSVTTRSFNLSNWNEFFFEERGNADGQNESSDINLLAD